MKQALLERARRTLFGAASRFVSKATLVEGRLKGSEHRLRLLLAGSSLLIEEVKRRSFDEPPGVVRQVRLWTPLLKRWLATRSPAFDVCVAVVAKRHEPVFRGLYDHRGTEEVRQVIDTTVSWEDARKAFVKKKRQITNDFEAKHGLSYRISHEPADFDLFYHRMHVPLIRKRYGALAELDSYDGMRRFFERGQLLLVASGGRDVAGALSVLQDGTLMFRRSGVLDGDETHVKAGAQTALYYFQLRHCIQSGYRALDAMKSSPFLDDGVFRHKAEWGATVLPDEEAEDWAYYFGVVPGAKTARFFELNPVVVENGDRLMAVVGDSRCEGAPAERFEELAERYPSRGLSAFTVVGSGGLARLP